MDRLLEQGEPAIGLNAGGAARDPTRFQNARAEWYWGLRDRFEQGEIAICPDDELAAQLAGIRYAIDSSGRIGIESKPDMRSRGIASPDIADALTLAFSAPKEPFIPCVSPIDFWRESPWRIRSDWRYLFG